MSLIAEAPGFIQVFSNGTIKRFAPQTVPSTSQVSNKYISKDVLIDPSKPITARIFIPSGTRKPEQRLPILVYYHGGGFCIGSTTWIGYHVFLGNLSVVAQAVVLSIDYRLAPEHKVPTIYDDSYAALEWLGSKKFESWLEQADLSRVFLSGDSAGGNIAHQVTIQAVKKHIPNVRIKGLLPIHPFFGSESRTNLEMADGSTYEVAMNDMFWKLSLPDGSSRDFYGCNFENEEMNDLSLFPEVMVFVAGVDFLKERGVMYVEFLKEKGVKNVSLIEAKGEPHVFHVWNPESDATYLMQKQIASFMQTM